MGEMAVGRIVRLLRFQHAISSHISMVFASRAFFCVWYVFMAVLFCF